MPEILAILTTAATLLPELEGIGALVQKRIEGHAFNDEDLAKLDDIAQALNAKAEATAASQGA